MNTPESLISTAASELDGMSCQSPASCLLIRAYRALGEPARALAVYAALRDQLATELGADPAQQTQALYLAVLREETAPTPRPAGARIDRAAESLGLVGRGDELVFEVRR